MSVTRRPSLPALNPRLRASIRRIAGSHGARNVRLFGSFARGEQTGRSDLDLLVELPEHSSLLDVARLKVELEGVMRRRKERRCHSRGQPQAFAAGPHSCRSQAVMRRHTKNPTVYLEDILVAATRIEGYTKGGKKRFLASEMMQDAVIRKRPVRRRRTLSRRIHTAGAWKRCMMQMTQQRWSG